MLNDVERIPDSERDAYLSSLQKELDIYANKISKIYKMHEESGFFLSNSCYANFRDSLFHYRRIAELTEKTEILNQAFALREHLYRGIKDGLINYMQELSKHIEDLYNHTGKYTDELIQQMIQNIDKKYLSPSLPLCQQLDYMCKDGYSEENMKFVFLFHYHKHKNTRKILQQQMHKLRNECLIIRKGALLIERPYEKNSKELETIISSVINVLKQHNLSDFVFLSDYLINNSNKL